VGSVLVHAAQTAPVCPWGGERGGARMGLA